MYINKHEYRVSPEPDVVPQTDPARGPGVAGPQGRSHTNESTSLADASPPSPSKVRNRLPLLRAFCGGLCPFVLSCLPFVGLPLPVPRLALRPLRVWRWDFEGGIPSYFMHGCYFLSSHSYRSSSPCLSKCVSVCLSLLQRDRPRQVGSGAKKGTRERRTQRNSKISPQSSDSSNLSSKVSDATFSVSDLT